MRVVQFPMGFLGLQEKMTFSQRAETLVTAPLLEVLDVRWRDTGAYRLH
jgi:hypothetical protein